MKGIARLLLVCVLTYIVILTLIGLLVFVHAWIQTVDSLYTAVFFPKSALLESFKLALPSALYLSILIGISYSVRRKVHAVPSLIILIVLIPALCTGSAELLEALINTSTQDQQVLVPDLKRNGLMIALGEETLIIAGPETDPALVAVKLSPYQAFKYYPEGLGSLPEHIDSPNLFNQVRPSFVFSMAEDFKKVSDYWFALKKEKMLFFIGALAAISFLLVSLRGIMSFSAWPFANLVLSLIAFRLVLYLDVLLASEGTRLFLQKLITIPLHSYMIYMVPLCLLAVLLQLYSLLSFIAGNRGITHEEL